MSEQDQNPTPEAPQEQVEDKRLRKIRSFVKREGRLTKRQENALSEFWPMLGLDHQASNYSLEAVFGRNAKTVLEIGFGMGASLVEMAKNAPDTNFIGIEVHRPGVGACMADAIDAEIKNLRVFEHDAVEILNDSIADNSLDTVQLFFPDPWHKSRHHKRRIVQLEFVEVLRKKLKVGGVFHMATDWENYAEHMLEVMQAAPGYKNTSETNDYVPRPEWRPLTKFENRGHRLGHGVWDLIFAREA
ncbi:MULTISPECIES: tRNA (guanosine(46)-N7)-methyltransferase TrmB [unclassified Agarivorans]|uniref:tRNA (guanosine(46)-N7)-methyltransferase TrmB n=1 Tax=unclassified Agarivorans TaxID=2636026 RepID=UPI0026E181A7|nr:MULTISPECIES: tRNA (guanosine(46)-N7)-methyltransferase TrmB [unclassified Agarivorans]MDO6685151.1 tRNA (guanosine(46)-N7)-methyltransferase TrmB [Agarivorans sp. 3_MG-2023]MDO6715677.1 tRNA (guanosine(46)-N7)-methyltransferase TrmB [Agarivorans sp. 2_MG-2023]